MIANARRYYLERQGDMVLQLAGPGWVHFRDDIPNFEGQEFTCFGGINLIDMNTNRLVGKANDCIRVLEEKEDGSLLVQGHTFMDFWGQDDVDTLMLQGPITICPVLTETKTAFGMTTTHTTGSGNTGVGGVIGGSGIYEGASGNSRLSGMLNLSRFSGKKDEIVEFSCLFVVSDLSLSRRVLNRA